MASNQIASVLSLDVGTSSTRSALFDLRGCRIEGSTFQIKYPLRTAPDGTAELDPAKVLRAVRRCLAGTLSKGGVIHAAGMSCFWHSLLGTDFAGTPLTPIYTWADSRCRDDAAKLREELCEAEYHEKTGCMLRASFWPAKLRWLRRTQPRRFRSVALWISPAEWLQWMLTGSATCSTSMAAGTGLAKTSVAAWDEEILDLCGISAVKLLPMADTPAFFQKTPWLPGIGDGAASNLGSGATRSGRAAINYGTSAALRVMRQGLKVTAPFGLFGYRVDKERYVLGGAVSNAGNLRAWCLRELQLPASAAALERQFASSAVSDILVLPFFAAERAPDWNEEDRATLHGVTLGATSLDLLQAITEGSLQRCAKIASLVSQHCRSSPQWIVSGGLLRSKATMQRFADVLGEAIYPNPEPEASLRGAAVFALEHLKVEIPELKLSRAFQPRAHMHRKYRDQAAKLELLQKRLQGA